MWWENPPSLFGSKFKDFNLCSNHIFHNIIEIIGTIVETIKVRPQNFPPKKGSNEEVAINK